eukprot:TRINITY_DN90373_c0_g1_i1.p1 TRINITY_DN90373_c0_g1~~TRINITY_DN90373_c0_g1_i1.p1  ORF type:complete len:682 (-),score=101.12 TRINITY_DN90373_c0_g1_i1:450-2495(-)
MAHTDIQVRLSPEEAKGMQESDLMETMLPDGEGAHMVDSATEHIRLVSLGQNCGPKLSFKHLGRGAASLPFDWSRTRLDGILKYIREDFKEWYDYVTREPVPGIQKMIMFRDQLHSFWHDDPNDPGMRERYDRRIERFNQIDARTAPVLFVRVVVVKSEVIRMAELLLLLQDKYGPQAHLLCILNHQERAQGPSVVQGWDNLMVYFLEKGAHSVHKRNTAYATPIKVCLDWMVGRPTSALPFDGLEQAHQVADQIQITTLDGLGGLQAFEAHHEDHVYQKAEAASSEPQPIVGDNYRKVQLVSLGHNSGPKLAFNKLGMSEGGALPFDWANTKMTGVLQFLRTDFQGFLDVKAMESTSWGGCRRAFRGKNHSFWYDDLLDSSDTGAMDEYERRLKRFRALDAKSSPVLFVRVAATSDEVSQAVELVSELMARFGQQAHLLLILDNQSKLKGPSVIGDHKQVMLYFLDRTEHGLSKTLGQDSVDQLAGAYAAAVQFGLDWTMGKPLTAMSIPSVAVAAASFVDEDRSGLQGFGGLAAFEGDAPAEQVVMLPTNLVISRLPRRPAAVAPAVPAVAAAGENGVVVANGVGHASTTMSGAATNGYSHAAHTQQSTAAAPVQSIQMDAKSAPQPALQPAQQSAPAAQGGLPTMPDADGQVYIADATAIKPAILSAPRRAVRPSAGR